MPIRRNGCAECRGWSLPVKRGVKRLPHFHACGAGLYAPVDVTQLPARAPAARLVRQPRAERSAHVPLGIRGRVVAHALAAGIAARSRAGGDGPRYVDAPVLLGLGEPDLRGAHDRPEGQRGRGDDQLSREQRYQPHFAARFARSALGVAGGAGCGCGWGTKGRKLSRARPATPKGGNTEHQITRLSLLLTLAAVGFFS